MAFGTPNILNCNRSNKFVQIAIHFTWTNKKRLTKGIFDIYRVDTMKYWSICVGSFGMFK